MKTKDRVVINIIGVGYNLSIGNTPLTNIGNQNSVTDNKFVLYSGANILEKGQVELWLNHKRKKTILFSEINESKRLFPFFNIETDLFRNKPNQILTGEQEKGLIARIIISEEKFDIENLKLHITCFEINNLFLKLINAISYNGQYLKSKKSDTVLTGTLLENCN